MMPAELAAAMRTLKGGPVAFGSTEAIDAARVAAKYKQRPCKNCSGIGRIRVSEPRADRPGFTEWQVKPCPDCEGTGKVWVLR